MLRVDTWHPENMTVAAYSGCILPCIACRIISAHKGGLATPTELFKVAQRS